MATESNSNDIRNKVLESIKTGHVTMLVEPYVEVLAGQVQACLARAHAENSQPA